MAKTSTVKRREVYENRIWVQRPQKTNLRMVKKTKTASRQAEDTSDSPDFEEFMNKYGMWSDFA